MEQFAVRLFSAGIFHGLQQRLVDLIVERIEEAVHTPPLDEVNMQINEFVEYEEDPSDNSEWEVEEGFLVDLPASCSSHLITNSFRGDG